MIAPLARTLRDRSSFAALLLLLVLAAALAFAACSGDDGQQQSEAPAASDRAERDSSSSSGAGESGSDSSGDQDADDAEQQEQQQAQATPAAPSRASSPAGDGVLRIARSQPLNMDPAQVTDVPSAVFVIEIFGGLLTLDPELRIAPDLAESVPSPTINSDGTVTYRFTLRRNATFHDGRRITAEDVKWSFERHADSETLSPTAPDFLGDIVGVREYTRGRIDSIPGIEVVDDLTLDITIDSPKPYFLYKLTYPTAFVVDRNEIEADPDGWSALPNGSGPFKLAEWTEGDRIVLERFDDYHLEPAKVQRVEVRFAGGGLDQFENGEIDIGGVSASELERVRDPADPLNELYVSRAELSVFYIAFNTTIPPFDDPLVRRAFAHAIDKQTLAEEVLLGAVQPAAAIVPPGLAAHDADYRGLVFDPELARELLEQSRYFGSQLLEDVRLTTVGGGATPGGTVEAVLAMWETHLGLAVQPQQLEFASFLTELDRSLHGMFQIGWVMDFPDPQNVLDYKFHSASLGNDADLDDPEIDELLEGARVEQDQEVRTDIYRRVDKMLIEDAVWVPLFYGVNNEVIQPYVQGYVPPRSIVPILRYISVAG